MSEQSAIEWTDATWNPVTGCSKVSPGCAHCYAETLSLRFGWSSKAWTPQNAAENVVLHPERLDAPLRWRRPRRVFVNSMSDLFHEAVPDQFIDRMFAVMALCGGDRYRCQRDHDHDFGEGCGTRQPRQTFQILTKRPERMRAYLSDDTLRDRIIDATHETSWYWYLPELIIEDAGWPLRNVWLGVSVENQRFADERIPLLLQTPAVVRFLSCEPLLGSVDLSRYMGCHDPLCGCEPWLDWVIVGGESGPKHRPFDVAWARSLRDQCRDAGVAYFVKQLGGVRPGTKLDDLPEDLRIREYPR